MNVFDTIDELWVHTLESLLESMEASSRNGLTKEQLGYHAVLTNIDSTFLLNERRKLSPIYACAEFLWYLKHTKSIEMIKAYAPQYEKFAEDNEAFGAYGWRMYENLNDHHNISQLQLLINLLQRDPGSRQAVITLWNANDLAEAIDHMHKDLPCTLSMQFLVRDSQLNLIVTMRSNDAWLGLPYDIFAFTCIQRVVAQALGLLCGTYTHQAGSEHLYEKNWQAAYEAIQVPFTETLTHDWNNGIGHQWREDIQTALLTEGRYRKDLNGSAEHFSLCYNLILHDVVSCCARKFNVKTQINSPILRKGLERCLS